MMIAVSLRPGTLPVENTLLVSYATSHRHGLEFGSKLLLGFGFSATGTYLSGWIFDLSGSFNLFYVLLVLLASVIAIISFFLPRQRIL